jgi:hypothetical protein
VTLSSWKQGVKNGLVMWAQEKDPLKLTKCLLHQKKKEREAYKVISRSADSRLKATNLKKG